MEISINRSNQFLIAVVGVLVIAMIIPSLQAGSLQVLKPAYASGIGNIQVYVGYADNLRASAVNFPTPWQGSANINFIGTASNLQVDAGAIRIDNVGSTPITINSVQMTLPAGGSRGSPQTFNLWGTFTIAPHTGTIVTQTAQYNFDTSDFPVNGCNTALTNGQAPVPVINITSGVNSQVFLDNGHVLDTLGFDSACNGNESTPWTLIGGSALQYSEELQVNNIPLSGAVSPGTNVTEVAKSTDLTIDHVTFTWKDPSNNIVRTVNKTVNTDSLVVSTLGGWDVCVDFFNAAGQKRNSDPVCSPFTVGQQGPVGGIIIPADISSLFIAGTMANASWMLPTVVGVIGAAITFLKVKRKQK